jgi:Adaptor complexes medium subunit family
MPLCHMLLQPSCTQEQSAPDAACALAQVFLDVVESVNLLVNSNGTVVRSEVVGALKMRTYLSGMPECKLGLNDKVGSKTTPLLGY